jgi:UDPglucose 6-dehydrogenase
MKIIIAGYGFVGTAVAHALSGHHELVIVDPRFNRTQIANHEDLDGVIVCVGTPSADNGDCDLSQVMSVLSEIPNHKRVMIKSTVPPDQLIQLQRRFARLKLTYSPEFLRAVSATQDFLNQTYMILGDGDTKFWQSVFQPCLAHCEQYMSTDMSTASMVKYCENTFLATKVAFFNHVYDLCQVNGVNYTEMQTLLAMDPRIGSSHMQVPGPDGNRGFGGHCFPKDTEAFVQYAQRAGLPFELLETTVDYNKKLQKNNRKNG